MLSAQYVHASPEASLLVQEMKASVKNAPRLSPEQTVQAVATGGSLSTLSDALDTFLQLDSMPSDASRMSLFDTVSKTMRKSLLARPSGLRHVNEESQLVRLIVCARHVVGVAECAAH